MRSVLPGPDSWDPPSVATTPKVSIGLAEKNYDVRLARDERDLLAAQRLRFEVFNLELRMGLAGSFASGLDQDAYDRYCEHLIVVDRREGSVVGTFRLLLSDRVPSFGFYSETEFHLENVKRKGVRLLELGRSCVAPDYRSGRVIHLLFRKIAVYAQENGVDAMMGCASIRGCDIEELRRICALLRGSYWADSKFRVTPKRGFDLPGIETPLEIDEAEVFRKLPPLFKGYLRLGAKICGLPAFDRQFGTTDFFLLLPTGEVVERHGRRTNASPGELDLGPRGSLKRETWPESSPIPFRDKI
ncbi:MAG: GNAT family N-acetyltransferase [Candidatus Deferrimicrobiaceae bacterium]